MSTARTALAVLFIAAATASFAAETATEARQKEKPPATVTLAGSDTMVVMLTALAEQVQKGKGMKVSVSGGGSGVGIAALAAGRAQIATSSRPIKAAELEKIEARGVKVAEVLLAHDVLVMVAHPASEVKSLTLPQLREIWLPDGKARQWLDIEKTLPSNIITLYAPDSSTGTFSTFLMLLGQQQQPAFKLHPDVTHTNKAAEIVAAVAADKHALGLARLPEAGESGKLLPIAKDQDSKPVAPGEAAVAAGEYPLSNSLYLYTTQAADPAVKALLDFLGSDEAKKIIRAQGFVPAAAPKAKTPGDK